MTKKRTQLNINIDEELLKALKFKALSKNIKLNTLVKQILSENTKRLTVDYSSSGFSDNDAINCTNFMKSLFEKTSQNFNYLNHEEAFKALISQIEKFDQWNDTYSKRLYSVLLGSGEPWTSSELNKLTLERECECPIYAGLKIWTGSDEFPSQDLICDLGSSLVPIIENKIKPS
ncbi:hypothetical protein OA778_03270 [Prochlorococcus sp. AH-716-I09]|nr:hypothetical protein [Prochlorococcus sp. AH-716-I09]